MEKIKLFTLPNLITCLNLLSGCAAILMAFMGDIEWALFMIIAGAVFDFFDGFVARLTKSYSTIGVQLDSLADMVTFGLAPSFVVFSTLESMNSGSPLNYIAFLIAVFSALRLAKFNVDTRQSTEFIGLPTPANALLLAGLGRNIVVNAHNFPTDTALILLLILIPICSFLLVSEIPMFSLKFKSFGINGNKLRYIFLLTSLILLIIFKLDSFPIIIGLYIVISLAKKCYLCGSNKNVECQK